MHIFVTKPILVTQLCDSRIISINICNYYIVFYYRYSYLWFILWIYILISVVTNTTLFLPIISYQHYSFTCVLYTALYYYLIIVYVVYLSIYVLNCGHFDAKVICSAMYRLERKRCYYCSLSFALAYFVMHINFDFQYSEWANAMI